jgi:uncharacterized delta-60 repeat protein
LDQYFDFAAQADGKVLGLSNYYLVRTNAGAHALDTTVSGGTGHVTPSFTIATTGPQMAAGSNGGVATTAGGKVFAAGFAFATFTNPNAALGLARLGTDLSLDTTFHTVSADGLSYAGGTFVDGGVTGQGSQVAETADGHIMLMGFNGYHNVVITRLTSTGAPDTLFGTSGYVAQPTLPSGVLNEGASIRASLVDRVGRTLFVINGYTTASGLFGPLVTRFDAHGIQDKSFGTNGWSFNNTFDACPSSGVQSVSVNPLAIDSAGRILVIGSCDSGSGFAVIRLRGDTGALDTSFGIDGLAHGRFDPTSNSEQGNAIAFDGAGHLFIGGETHPSGKNFQAAVARLTYDLIYTSDFESTPRGCLPPNCGP